MKCKCSTGARMSDDAMEALKRIQEIVDQHFQPRTVQSQLHPALKTLIEVVHEHYYVCGRPTHPISHALNRYRDECLPPTKEVNAGSS